MARYELLPIYKATLDAAAHFEQVVAGFSRYHKYTLGTELRRTSRGVVLGIIRANSARERLPQLLGLRDLLEELLAVLRLAKEVKAFKRFRAYQNAVRVGGYGLQTERRVEQFAVWADLILVFDPGKGCFVELSQGGQIGNRIEHVLTLSNGMSVHTDSSMLPT